MPSILPPISLPLLIHTRPIPIPHTFRSQPTHLLPPSHSPSVRSPLSFRPQPTPRPSPAHSPLSVTHRTCSPVTMSSTTSNIFPCPLVLLSTCHIPLSPLAYNLFTRPPIHSSTYNVTHRTCSSVTLSLLATNVFPCPPFPCLLTLSTPSITPLFCPHL